MDSDNNTDTKQNEQDFNIFGSDLEDSSNNIALSSPDKSEDNQPQLPSSETDFSTSELGEKNTEEQESSEVQDAVTDTSINKQSSDIQNSSSPEISFRPISPKNDVEYKSSEAHVYNDTQKNSNDDRDVSLRRSSPSATSSSTKLKKQDTHLDIDLYPEKNGFQKRIITMLAIIIVILLAAVIIGGVYVKNELIDKKDEEITLLNQSNNNRQEIINSLSTNLENFEATIDEQNEDLEKTASKLENTSSMLNFMLGESASQLVSRYLSPYVNEFSKYNIFENGIDNEDYKLLVSLGNASFDYIGDQEENKYISTIKYLTVNNIYKKLFGSKTSLPTRSSSIKWCNSNANAYFDQSMFESNGGFGIKDYSNQACEWPTKTFVYTTGQYYVTDDGFDIEEYIGFANPILNEKGEFDKYHITLADGEMVDWGGYTSNTSSEEFAEQNKDRLPIYIFKFGQKDNNYYLKAIEKKN